MVKEDLVCMCQERINKAECKTMETKEKIRAIRVLRKELSELEIPMTIFQREILDAWENTLSSERELLRVLQGQ